MTNPHHGWKLVPVDPTSEMIQAASKECDRMKCVIDPVMHVWDAMLASAPAPASGRVDAVVRRAKYLLNRLETDDCLGIGEIDTMLRMAASLSPAAMPVSEAGGEAVKVLATLNRMVTDYLAPDTYKARFPKDSTLWEREFSMPDKHHSDAGAALVHRRRDAAFIRDVIHLQDNPTGVEPSEPGTLAKPASSPAPVRPIGNQGISDYQREIARNMAEGFAAWNAARQEALPSDEPASPAAMPVSEAGGDPTYVANCCNCGRIIDTREEDAGGDGWGHELSDERWVCSPECLDAVVEPLAQFKPAMRVSARHEELLVEALAEIKATVDGESDQPVRDIIYGLLDEIKALPENSARG